LPSQPFFLIRNNLAMGCSMPTGLRAGCCTRWHGRCPLLLLGQPAECRAIMASAHAALIDLLHASILTKLTYFW
jgi:hypothetical protein